MPVKNYIKDPDALIHGFITGYEIELTSRCNAGCPACSRYIRQEDLVDGSLLYAANQLSGVSSEVSKILRDKFGFDKPPTFNIGDLTPGLEMLDITIDDYKRIFPKELDLIVDKDMDFCGVFGDAICSPDVLPIMEHTVAQSPMHIEISTNGSIRTPEWWKELAQIFSSIPASSSNTNEDRCRVVFSIDGLEDTNHVYRKFTQWDKIIENAEAFINAGGCAVWDFLIFEHNAHQIEEASAFAKKIGFDHIYFKKSSRFVYDTEENATRPKPGTFKDLEKDPKDRGPVAIKTHTDRKRTENVEIKSAEEFKSPVLKEVERIRQQHIKKNIKEANIRHNSYREQIKKYNVVCTAHRDQRLFISHKQTLWPCCHLNDQSVFQGGNDDLHSGIQELFARYGKDFNSLKTNSIPTLLKHPWYREHLMKSIKTRVGLMEACINTCNIVTGSADWRKHDTRVDL